MRRKGTLITGAAGEVGQALVEKLAFEVVVAQRRLVALPLVPHPVLDVRPAVELLGFAGPVGGADVQKIYDAPPLR